MICLLLILALLCTSCHARIVPLASATDTAKLKATPVMTATTQTPRSENVTATPPPPGGNGQNGSSISGAVIAASDVQTLPDSPLPGVLVLAIRAQHADSLFSQAGTSGLANPSRLGPLMLSPERIQAVQAATAKTDHEGRYALSVPQGDYILCLANVGWPKPADDSPAAIYGCIEVTVPPHTQVNQNLFWGEAGVTSG